MAMRFYAEAQLGPKRRLTPEGFLVCLDVPLARTGTLLYAPGEVPIDPGPDKVIAIGREPDDVFDPQAMTSFEGKPVTNDHPPLGVKVDPSNWRQLAIGDVHNVRRGDGLVLDDQYLYGDLIIKDAAAIQDVLDGKREVSAGYDAEYEQLEPGRGRQHDIIGNHVALVDRGRCGPHCSIGDSDTMATRRGSFADRIRAAFKTRDEGALVEELDKVKDMLGEVVSDDMPPGMGEGSGSGHAININLHGMGSASSAPGMPKSKGPESVAQDDGEQAPPAQGATQAATGGDMPPWAQQMMQRMDTMEQAIMLLAQDEEQEQEGQQQAPATSAEGGETAPGKVEDDAAEIEGNQKKWPNANPGEVQGGGSGPTGDRRRAVGDSSSLATAFQDMLSKAAVLTPGVRLPTFDASRGARVTMDAMCDFRRRTLARAWSTDDGREVIGRLHQARKADFSRDAMTCDAVTILFNGAAALAGGAITQDSQRRFAAVMDHGRELPGPTQSRVPTPAELNAIARKKFGLTA